MQRLGGFLISKLKQLHSRSLARESALPLAGVYPAG